MSNSVRTLIATAFVAASLLALPACQKKGTGLEQLQPEFGSVAGNEDVIISGRGFKPGIMVHFGKHKVKKLIIESPNKLRVKTPSGAEGKVDVIMTDDTGKTFVLSGAFTYRKGK